MEIVIVDIMKKIMKKIGLMEKKYLLLFSAIIFVVLLFLWDAVGDVAKTRYLDSDRISVNERVSIGDVADDGMKGLAIIVPTDLTGVLCLSFSAENKTENDYSCQLALFNDSYSIIDGDMLQITPGQKEYSATFDLYRNRTDTSFFYCLVDTEATDDISFADVNIEVMDYKSGYRTTEKVVVAIIVFFLVIDAMFFLISLFGLLKNMDIGAALKSDVQDSTISWIKVHWEYYVLPVFILVGLIIIFNDVDLTYPIQVGHISDDKAYFFHSREILDGSLNLICERAGGADGLEQFDIPNTDKFQILLIAIIGCMTQNPYLASNLFYMCCFFLVGYTACYATRSLGIGRLGAILVGVLYAFSTFMLQRYYHLWLCAYFMMPLAILVAVEAMIGKNSVKSLNGKRVYYKGLILSFLCAFSDLYYAYFSCAVFSIAVLYCLICDDKVERINHFKRNISYIAMTVAGCFICIIPNLLYWSRNPLNTDNDLYRRPIYQTDQYSLRIIQMFLPSDEHRISFLRNITDSYEDSFGNTFLKQIFINENVSAAIGIVSVIGILIAFVALLKRGNDELVRCLSAQIFLVMLIATAGGGGSLMSLVANIPVRSYNRMSLVIMFCALLIFVFFLEKKMAWIKKKSVLVLIYAVILIIGFFDQTHTVRQTVSFVNIEKFFRGIDETRTAGREQAIFVLPYQEWPNRGNHLYLIGLTEGIGDKWSAPSPEGRNEAEWQQFVSSLETSQMMDSIKASGYTGVYFDAEVYQVEYGPDAADSELSDLVSVLGEPDVADQVNHLYYWTLE